MLINNFFTINNILPGEKYTVDISLNPNHEVYKGHFPGNPIAPGVCLTQMVKETIEQITGKNLFLTNGDNIKFTAILNPNENPNVVLSITLKEKENNMLHADAQLKFGEISFFSFKGSFKAN